MSCCGVLLFRRCPYSTPPLFCSDACSTRSAASQAANCLHEIVTARLVEVVPPPKTLRTPKPPGAPLSRPTSRGGSAGGKVGATFARQPQQQLASPPKRGTGDAAHLGSSGKRHTAAADMALGQGLPGSVTAMTERLQVRIRDPCAKHSPSVLHCLWHVIATRCLWACHFTGKNEEATTNRTSKGTKTQVANSACFAEWRFTWPPQVASPRSLLQRIEGSSKPSPSGQSVSSISLHMQRTRSDNTAGTCTAGTLTLLEDLGLPQYFSIFRVAKLWNCNMHLH